MVWKTSADVVAVLHVVWVAAVLLGPLMGWRNAFWRGVHLVLVCVTALAWSFYCPLTTAEHALRSHFDPRVGFPVGFLERYLRPMVDLREYGSALAWGVRGWAVLWAILYGIRWGKEVHRPPFPSLPSEEPRD